MAEFDIDETIQSQYAASSHVVSLIHNFWQAMDPNADIKKLYDSMINPDTAVGFGLDVWGRIVAIGRELIVTNASIPYFGFRTLSGQPVEGALNSNFDNSQFYKSYNGIIKLADNAYKNYIFLKALVNIGDSSLAFLNKIVAYMFPKVKIQIIHVDTMTLRIVLNGYLDPADKALLLKLPWVPAGVLLEAYQIITPTFSFFGQGLDNFDNSTFGYTFAQKVEI